MRNGGRPVVSASRAFDHVGALLAQHPGLTQRHVARLAGISESGITVARKTMRIDVDTEDRLLAVTSRHVALCPPPEMPAYIAREHVQWLMDETGLPRLAVARASGVNRQTVYNVMKPDKPIVKLAVHAAIMACTPDDLRGVDFWQPRWPSIVRLRALQANQWSLVALGEQFGMNLAAHTQRPADSAIERTAAARIKSIYETIGDTVGPSPRSGLYARRLGFMPPIYYDDDMNPVESTVDTAAVREQQEARVDLCILGLTVEHRSIAEIVETLGLAHDRRVSRVRRRAGLRIERTLAGDYEARDDRPGALAAVRRAVRPVHYRSTIDWLDEPDIDYVALLASAIHPETSSAAA